MSVVVAGGWRLLCDATASCLAQARTGLALSKAELRETAANMGWVHDARDDTDYCRQHAGPPRDCRQIPRYLIKVTGQGAQLLESWLRGPVCIVPRHGPPGKPGVVDIAGLDAVTDDEIGPALARLRTGGPIYHAGGPELAGKFPYGKPRQAGDG
jgi:hypothetical protein